MCMLITGHHISLLNIYEIPTWHELVSENFWTRSNGGFAAAMYNNKDTKSQNHVCLSDELVLAGPTEVSLQANTPQKRGGKYTDAYIVPKTILFKQLLCNTATCNTYTIKRGNSCRLHMYSDLVD